MGLVLFVANEGFLDDVDVTKVVAFESALLDYFNSEHAALRDEINESGNYNDDIAAKLKACVESFKSSRTY
jgi:F-type H+-transporting ATPase subunit alpha